MSIVKVLGCGEGDLRRLQDAQRVRLGKPTTPVGTGELAGRTLYVKRVDLPGFGRGGGKARKPSHLLGWMAARGAEHLITAAGNVTNPGFELVDACDRLGIELTLFIVDDPPLAPHLRERVFR